jgi:hypothetical protein
MTVSRFRVDPPSNLWRHMKHNNIQYNITANCSRKQGWIYWGGAHPPSPGQRGVCSSEARCGRTAHMTDTTRHQSWQSTPPTRSLWIHPWHKVFNDFNLLSSTICQIGNPFVNLVHTVIQRNPALCTRLY